MEGSDYKVKTTQFEGPLELLLSLIETRKLFINDISLSEVTNDYIEYIKSQTGRDINEITSFISIASTLILIKARSLLPNMELTEEEKSDVKNLEDRLNIYKKISETVLLLQSHIKENKYSYAPLLERKVVTVFAPTPDINLLSLESALRDVIKEIPEKEPKLQEVVVRVTIGIEEMINRITDRIEKAFNTSFSDFCKAQSDGKDTSEIKVVTIVSFLAMLELIKEGIVDALQGSAFEDMTIVKMEKVPEELEEKSDDTVVE